MAAPQPLRRTLRLMSADGVAFSVMVGAGESYLPAFALALGMSGLAAGLVATLPMAAGGLLQLLAPRGIRRLGGYRAWVVICAVLQAASFAPLVAAALSTAVPAAVVFASGAVYWAAGMATSPAWNAWAGRLVPSRMRGRYFGLRQSAMQAGVFVGLVGAGLCLEYGGDDRSMAFALVFAAAGAARLMSAALLAAHPDVSPEPAAAGPAVPLRGTPQWRWMLLVVAMHGAVNLSGPFFTPFLLLHVGLSYAEYTVLVSAVFVAKIVSLPVLGRLAAGGSVARMMAFGAAGIALTPLLWTVADGFAYLLAVQVVSGVSWGAFELAAQLGFLAVAGEHERAALLRAFNALNSTVGAALSLAGGLLLALLGADRFAYLVLFWSSAAARLIAAAALFARVRGAGTVIRWMPMRVLAARPWGGAVLRPILALLPARAGDTGDAVDGEPDREAS